MRTVAPERTGWRDMNLSERHRLWGWDCPAVDLDFLFLEYDKGRAVAIVEYKHERARPQMPLHPTYQAMTDLADRASIPFFGCRYKEDFSQFMVIPLNANAKSLLSEKTPMSEAGWVSFLYQVRGRKVPERVIESLMQKI